MSGTAARNWFVEVERETISIMVEYLAHAAKSFEDEGSYSRSVLLILPEANRREEFKI